jgi:hypothetical protein
MYFFNISCIDQIKILTTEVIFSVGLSVLIFFIFEVITKLINFFLKKMRLQIPGFFLVMVFLGVCGLFFICNIAHIDKLNFDIGVLQMVIIDIPWIFWFFPLVFYIISLIAGAPYVKVISIFACFVCFVCLFFFVYHDILFLCKYKI